MADPGNKGVTFSGRGKSAKLREICLTHFADRNERARRLLLGADFPQMNFTQLHEHLRLELLRKMQRGALSVSLLARQAGFGQSHISNFLRKKRQLSLRALDRVLVAQHMTVGDLLSVNTRRSDPGELERKGAVPLVSQLSALFEPYIRPSSIRRMVYVSPDLLAATRPGPATARRPWERFVAFSVPADDAQPMDPVILPDAIVLLDRHYKSPARYRPERLNLYAVRNGSRLVVRYVDFVGNRLVLRPHNLAFPVDLLEIPPGDTLGDWIAGRIALVIKEV